MLRALAIRDIVLIERLDLAFRPGLTVLTGETGAGKSILLDSLGLALGARADSGLVRAGAEQASVTAAFAPPSSHPARDLLHEHGLGDDGSGPDGEIVLRRVLGRDGRSRAFVDDQPVGAALLRRVGALLVEVQGQGDQMGLADPAQHAPLLDSFGVDAATRARTRLHHARWREAARVLGEARDAIAAAQRDEAFLRHAVDELGRLAPRDGEEEELAAERQRLQQAEKRGEAIAAAISELSPGHGRGAARNAAGPGAALRAAARALQRLAPAALSGGDTDDGPAAPALAALERAEEALGEAEVLLARLAHDAEADPRALEQTEERLFALRAAARKHDVPVAELPAFLSGLRARLEALDTGATEVAALEQQTNAARADYVEACGALTEVRRRTARRLDQAVAHELPPLRLDRARFVTEVATLPEPEWGPGGADAVRFLIATNPGQQPGPLARVASGGELSRLMLALKVVLASGSSVPTLIFDEVDSGVGGATAAAVGERLARVAEGVQVLAVTHSPQVAARGGTHLRVSKAIVGGRSGRAETRVEVLEAPARREEIARMLAGETVTEAARAAASDLLGAA